MSSKLKHTNAAKRRMVANASSRRTRDRRTKLQLLVIKNGPSKGRLRSACHAIVAVRKPRGLLAGR